MVGLIRLLDARPGLCPCLPALALPACFSISAFLPLSCRPAHHLTFGAWPPICMVWVSGRPGGGAFYFVWKPKQCSSYMSLLGSSFCKPISSIDASTSVECSIANYCSACTSACLLAPRVETESIMSSDIRFGQFDAVNNPIKLVTNIEDGKS